MQTMFLMRGLPGSGKSTLARKLAKDHGALTFATDDFFLQDGKYVHNADKLPEAHQWNQDRVEAALDAGKSVVVDNCNVLEWHAQPYIDMAKKRGVPIEIRVGPMNDAETDWLFYNNGHGVPFYIIQEMREQWEELGV